MTSFIVGGGPGPRHSPGSLRLRLGFRQAQQSRLTLLRQLGEEAGLGRLACLTIKLSAGGSYWSEIGDFSRVGSGVGVVKR